MKKGLLLTLISSIPLLAGCMDSSKVSITFGKMFDASLGESPSSLYIHTENLSYSDLARKVNNKENFVLLVYEYKTLEEGKNIECTCFAPFATSLIKYMEEKDAQIFAIDPMDLEKKDTIFSLNISLGEQTLAIFKDGKIFSQSLTGNEALSTYNKVSSYLDNIVSWSDMLYINKSQLDRLTLSGERFVTGFLRKSCSDCQYLSYNLLKDYNRSSFKNKIYVIETDVEGIRYKNGEYDEDTWQEFKDNYGLSSLYNTKYGYKDGFVPTFLVYQGNGNSLHPGSEVIDGALYLNDEISLKDGRYVVSSSYWGEMIRPFFLKMDRNIKYNLIGLEIDENDVLDMGNGKYSWSIEKAKEYHDPLFKTFLDFYAKA